MTTAASSAARLAHLTPREYPWTVTVASRGEFVRMRKRGADGGGGGGRGVIRGFSRESRKRLIDLLHMCDRQATGTPLFVTLTYPGEYPDTWTDYKRHLDSWLKRLRRRWPRAAVIWRLEFQARGAPHYHCLVFNVPYIPHEWVARSWFEVVGSGDAGHLAAGTEVTRVRTWRGAKFYVAKYLGKRCLYGSEQTGRMWGVRGKLPITLTSVRMSEAAWFRMRRVLRKFYQKKTGRRAWWTSQRASGITAYLPDGEAWRLYAWAVVGS